MDIEQTLFDLKKLHQDSIVLWKQKGLVLTQTGFLNLVEENHAFNYQLWNEEDKARREDMGFEFVYHAKRNIDRFNQQRNNAMETIDHWLFEHLNPADTTHCPIHSETPGMMIDRLSILSLKHYHMHLQTTRVDASSEHHQQCFAKLAILHNQLHQLRDCLLSFLEEIVAKRRTFKVYHQLKMYNDKNLNPELYKKT